MSKLDHQKFTPRYTFVTIVMTLFATIVVARSFYIMTVERDYWMKVASRTSVDSVPIKPVRGNILSSDGQLMASSLPEYRLYMDFKAISEAKNDSLWDVKLDSICEGLHRIFPAKSAQDFKTSLQEGRQKKSRHWSLWPLRVNYNTKEAVAHLPVFVLGANKGGFHVEEFNARRRPFGTLASRTVGDLYGAKDTARFGLELSYDSVLRGVFGITHRRKVMNKFLSIVDTPPVDGADIVTTIDVGMQDLAERSLTDKLKEINANVGVAIVMEVETGDVKAIVNMERCGDGEYRERKNHAVSDLLEPGSVFKTVSMLVALDDGVVDTTYMINTGGGVWPMHGREMKDHNWTKGGYGIISFPRALEVSSNIGISRVIDEHYGSHPEKFVEGIYRTGIADDLQIPLAGSSHAIIAKPRKNSRGQYTNWSKTKLPWMSIGYETQVPPISTLTFYNAIANGGKMVRPRFVKEIRKEGQTIAEFPPVVMRDRIAKESTIKTMQTILEHVVSQGLGKKAGSPSFKVAGKTGTAQISQGRAGYRSGVTNYLVSFAGFFPAEKPRYSCIVCIQKSGLPASGGGQCGPVFREIAEGIMAQSLKLDITDARDELSSPIPAVKAGNLPAADYVLSHFGFNIIGGWGGTQADSSPIWGKVVATNKEMKLQRQPVYRANQMPDVTGMGARDAVYIIEKRGVKVKLVGRGKVVEQSIAPGRMLTKGMVCSLRME
ncbi:MAG: transpeptidase family protein [Prevotella sp.]|nr:transpeptidase family protein [Prevotella sp.]